MYSNAKAFYFSMLLKSVVCSTFLLSFAANSQPKDEQKSMGSGLSRAEVIADLALWRRAGVDKYEHIARSYGIESAAYESAYKEYLRLRNSGEYEAELRKARGN